MLNLPKKVTVVEVGPRDGLQNEPGVVPLAAKRDFVTALAKAGLPFVEATSFVHPKWVPQLADACHEELVLDLTALPAQPKETPAFVIAVQKVTESFGIKLTLVGSDEVKSTLGAFTETASLPWKDAA